MQFAIEEEANTIAIGIAFAIVIPEWVVHCLIQHEAEHRGQMGEIRLMAE